MIKRNTKRQLVINMFLLIIFTMGIGYAYLTSNLNINGTTEIAGNVWDIHFENIKITDGSVIAVNPTIINSNKDAVTYSIKLERPKDYYEFTVDVVNAGTLPGKVSISNLSGIDSQYLNIIDYSIKYIGGAPVNVGDILNAGRTKKIQVRVFYKDDIISSDLPSSNINLNLSYTLQYVQSNEEEILPVIDTYDSILKSTYLSTTYRDNIKTITLSGIIDEPDNVVESWDIGVEQNGNVMAYLVTNSEDNTMYDLYIQGDGGLVANPNSEKLFLRLSNLEKINNLNMLDTSDVTSMYTMFFNCSKIKSLDLSNFNTSSVTNISGIFASNDDENGMLLEEIKGLESFDTGNVTNMAAAFQNCMHLININLSNWDTSNVTNMNWLFNGCENLKIIQGIETFNTGNVENMNYLFKNCQKLETLDLSGWITPKVIGMYSMFNNCKLLRELDISNFNTSNVTDMGFMFSNCNVLENLNVSNFNTDKVESMKAMFNNCNMLESLNLSSFNTINVTDMSFIFSDCKVLESLDVSSFNTSNVENMKAMFNNCYALKSLNLSSFNTINVTDMSFLFNNCASLESIIGIAGFNTGKVENMESTFYGLKADIHLNLNSWDTSNVTSLRWTFGHSEGIKELHVSNWNVEKVTDMYGAFYLSTLTELDLSGWNTRSVQNINRLFNAAHDLSIVDMRNFDFSSVIDDWTYYAYVFNANSANILITVKDQTSKEWIQTRFTNLTDANVVIAT